MGVDNVYLNKINLKIMNRQKSKGKMLLNKSQTLNPDQPIENKLQESLAQQNEIEGSEHVCTETNVHQFILSEFKVKYDQLKSQYQLKKKQADSLLYEKKKLEIELLNHNVQYYQKEIVRLGQEVQKYQLENEQNKHRYITAQNSKKDLQATAKLKQEELKTFLKQLEKEKITVVQLRHQLTEKDRNFSTVIESMEKSNHQISGKFDEANTKIAKLESQIKVKGIEADQTRRELQKKEKQLSKHVQETEKQKQRRDLLQYRLKHQLQDLDEDIKDYKAKQNQQINKLKGQVQDLKGQLASEQLLLTKRKEVVVGIRNIHEKELQIAALSQHNRQLQFQLGEKKAIIQKMEQQLRGVCSIELLHEAQDRYNQLLTKQKAVERNLQSRISQLQKQLEFAKLSRGSNSDSPIRGDFQQLLKNQIEENAKMKSQLAAKIDEVYSLKTTIQELQIRQSLYENQIEILKKKQRAEQKNSKISFEIEIQNLKNDVQSLKRKVQVTEAKLSHKTKETKDKDSFISSVIIGRSRQQDVPFILAELQRVFESDYASKLSQANLKIADLQARLQGR